MPTERRNPAASSPAAPPGAGHAASATPGVSPTASAPTAGGPPPLRTLAGRPVAENTKPFVIRRVDVAAVLGTCNLIDIFDRSREANRIGLRLDGSALPGGAPKEAPEDTIVLADGWTEKNTNNLIAASPRALWLMARAGLIPLSETQALEAILASGKRIERQRFPVAKVQTVQAPIMMLRMRAFGRGPRMGGSVPVETVRVR